MISRLTVLLGDELTVVSRKGVGDWLSREALVGLKSSRKLIMKCINSWQSQYLAKSLMSLGYNSGGSVAASCSYIEEVLETSASVVALDLGIGTSLGIKLVTYLNSFPPLRKIVIF